MKILVEFDVPESWDHYTEEQNLLSLTNWGATNDGVTAKSITDEQIKKVPEMIEALTKAEKILLEVHQYGLIGGLKDDYIGTVENIQSILKELES